jgi:hypothetical protein
VLPAIAPRGAAGPAAGRVREAADGSEFPWRGLLNDTPVLVVGETPKRYRIETLERIKVAGRWLAAGQRTVPKAAARREPDPVMTFSVPL